MQCIWRLVLAIIPMISSGEVLANLCEPKDASEFNQLVSTSGEHAEIITPATDRLLLNGVDTMVRIEAPPETGRLPFRLFAMSDMPADNGAMTQEVTEIVIGSVVRENNGTMIGFRPDLEARTVTLLFVGCNATAFSANPAMPTQFAVLRVRVSHNSVGLAWVAAFALLTFGLMALMVRANVATLGSRKKALYFLFSDYRREVSLSLFQLFIFSVAVILTAAYYFGRTGVLTDLSETVLLLLGISATGAVAGAWGDSMTNRLSWTNWRWLDRHGAFHQVNGELDLQLSQLVTTRGEFDLYRFQALLFTLLVAPSFVIAAAYTLGSMEIPTGILAVLGLSQATYLVGKFANATTMKDFDTALDEELKKFKVGERLTQAGFKELRAQFHAALGVTWANEEMAGHLIEVADPGPVELAELEAGLSAISAAAEVPLKADPAAALVLSEAAESAATEATKARTSFIEALYYSEAAAAAKVSAAAAQRAAKALAEIRSLPNK